MKFGILIISLLITNSLYGCFGENGNLENTEWETLDEIFIGKVIKVERKMIKIYPPFDDMLSLVGFETTFSVEKKWKGSNNSIVKITQSGSSCSEFFYIDDFNYFITAKRRKFTNNVKEDTKNTLYLTTEYTNLTISQRTQDSLYNTALVLMDSLYPKNLELTDQKNDKRNNKVNISNRSIKLLLFGLISGLIIMYLIQRQMKYNR